MMTIRDNYQMIVERMSRAARSAGRDPNEIRLVVVTKTHPVEVIKEVIAAGATELGENYVEDAIPKIIGLESYEGINWHMIGHIQSRKSSLVSQYFQYIHSIDSVKLAEKLNRSLAEISKSLPVLLEFNVAGEATKSGWNISDENKWDSVLADIEKILSLPNLNLQGLMTIPPFSSYPEESRGYYRQLVRFRDFLSKNFISGNFTQLSMGMSSDFEIAIHEGSTCVRIGQAIFGPRNN